MKDFDVVFQLVNPLGPYQKFHITLIIFSHVFMNAYVVFGLVFLAYKPEFWCTNSDDLNNITIKHGSMNSTSLWKFPSFINESSDAHIPNGDIGQNFFQNDDPCDCPGKQWEYSKIHFRSTLVTEWDLVCDKAIQPKIVINVLYAVTGVGCVVLAIIQDKFGRKSTINILTTLVLLGHVLTQFAPSLWVYTLMRSLASFTTQSVFNHGYVWAVEFVGPTKRTAVTVVMFSSYGVAISSFALLAYLANSWQDLSLAISLPFLLNYSYNWILCESPRWSIQKGRIEEAFQTLRKMLSWEGKSPDTQARTISDLKALLEIKDHKFNELGNLNNGEEKEIILSTENSQNSKFPSTDTQPPDSQLTSKPSIMSLFKTPNLRYKTILICICHLIINTTYIGLAFNTENLGGNPFVTFVAMSMMEVPAVWCNLVILERFGRILPLSGFLLFTGTICCVTSPASYFEITWLVILFSMLGKFGICLSSATMDQLEAELFPTELRATGKGFACMCAAVGNMIMPFIIHSATVYIMLPMIILGSLAGIGSFLAIQLPETRGILLPETVGEAEFRGISGLKTALSHLRSILRRRKNNYQKSVEKNGLCECKKKNESLGSC